MSATRKPQIVLADDHPALLAEAALILQQDYEVVGTAANGLELVDCVERLTPDLIVLDVSMPCLDGFGAIRRLKLAGNRVKIVFLTVWEDTDYAREAMALGADAYVVKSRMATDLIPAIAGALAEHRFVSPTLAL